MRSAECGVRNDCAVSTKAKASKLDPFAERLEEWFLAGKTLVEAQEQLALDGCKVSLGRLSVWWQGRQAERAEAAFLFSIASGAKFLKTVDAEFAEHPAPELAAIMPVLRTLVFELSVHAHADPAKLQLVERLLKPLMEFAKLQEKRREIELAENKYRDLVAARREAIQTELDKAKVAGGVTPETITKIEAELKLL